MSSAEAKKKERRDERALERRARTIQPEAEVADGTLPSLGEEGAAKEVAEESPVPEPSPQQSVPSEEASLEGKRLDVEAKKLDIELAKLGVAKLTLEVEKLGLEARKQAFELEISHANVSHASGKSSVTFGKLMSAGSRIKKERDSDGDSGFDGESSNSDSSSGSEGTGWTEVKRGKASDKAKSVFTNKAKSVFTTGEQSDWPRTKFVLNGPIDTLGIGKFIKELRNHTKGGGKGLWTEQEYKSCRKRYKAEDGALYKLMVESASFPKGETGGKRPKESTMSKAARTCEQGGTIPWGHGARFYLYIENLFENVKKTDPNFLLGACEDFRNCKMQENQTPVDWREYLVDKWNECSGSVNETEFVTRFVMKLTNDYRHVIDQYSLLREGDVWDIETAFTMVNNFWNMRVKKKKDRSDKDTERARRKQSKRDKKEAKADRDAGSEMYALQVPVNCDWCGEAGHLKNECTVENPTKYCKNCKSSTHWTHRCWDLKPKGKGKSKGKGKAPKGKGTGGKGKTPKGKRSWYQEKHFEYDYGDWTPSAVKENAPAPEPASSTEDNTQYEGGWQMNAMDCFGSSDDSEVDFSQPPLPNSRAVSGQEKRV